MHLSCELILCPVLRLPLPGWIKTLLYSVISSLGYTFYMPRFFNLPSRCRTSFIPVFSQRTILLTHASEQTCAFKTSSEIEGQQEKKKRVLWSFLCCSSNNSQRFPLFSLLIKQFCFLSVRKFPFHSLWSRERQLPAVTSKTIVSLPVNNCSGAGFDWSEQNKPLCAVFCIF